MSPQDDPQVLIVGAGPAGLAAARALAAAGIADILVIDRDDTPGGLPRFCPHSGFGLEYARWPYTGPGFARRLLRDLARTGVRIECGTTLLALREGPVAEVAGPRLGFRSMRPRAVILATGIRESNRANLQVPGGRAESGILTTGQLQQMVARNVSLPPGMKSAVIVGSEHVAFSAIWTARKAGLRVCALVEEADRVQSFVGLGALARAFGVEIVTHARLREIATAQGAPSAILLDTPQGPRTLPADAVVFTGNWIPEVAAFSDGPVTLDRRTGGPVIDRAMRTSLAGVFAAGNMLRGVESSGWCANEGRHAGLMVERFLRGEIAGIQAGAQIDLPADIAFLVPQLWDADAVAPPVSLRVNRDLRQRRLALVVGAEPVWSSRRRDFLCRRRIALPDDLKVSGPARLAID